MGDASRLFASLRCGPTQVTELRAPMRARYLMHPRVLWTTSGLSEHVASDPHPRLINLSCNLDVMGKSRGRLKEASAVEGEPSWPPNPSARCASHDSCIPAKYTRSISSLFRILPCCPVFNSELTTSHDFNATDQRVWIPTITTCASAFGLFLISLLVPTAASF